MKKKKLIIFGFILTSMLAVGVVFAAFIFQRVVDFTAETGNITIDKMCFGIYPISDSGEETEAQTPKELPQSVIDCYATKKHGWEGETNDCYLNQLSLIFEYTITMDVYLRVHIQDAWISTKKYTNGIYKTSYIEKDKIDGVSPFKPSNDKTDWVYDEVTNCIYYKYKISLIDSNNNTTTKKETKTMKQEFRLNNEYYYKTEATTSYKEHVTVKISYYIDAVQANRAEKKWNVNFRDLGIE